MAKHFIARVDQVEFFTSKVIYMKFFWQTFIFPKLSQFFKKETVLPWQ